MRSIGTRLVAASLSPLFVSAALSQEWTFVNLHPGEASSSEGIGASGGQQLGSIDSFFSGIWSGNAESWDELPWPFWMGDYYVTGIDAGQVVGAGTDGWEQEPPQEFGHALRWRANGLVENLWWGPGRVHVAHGISGSRLVGESDGHAMMRSDGSSTIDLHPAGAYASSALGCDSDQEVGYALFSGSHAALWTGTAASWVDLNPDGSLWSIAYGVYAGEQVGTCVINWVQRACLWRSTAASWVDLAPMGAAESSANAVFEGMQVGYAQLGGIYRAGLWRGSANSWVDLSAYLPAEFSGESSANGISSDGAFIYVVGTAYTLSGSPRAVLWRAPVPCEGDLDGNRSVDLQDLAVLLAHYGTPEGATTGDGDLDGDGDVDLQDLAELLARFGSTCL